MNYFPNNFYQNYNSQIQGRIVENEDIVRIAEISIGSYGVFPKADLSEIYLKTWNNNGTTKILKYKSVEDVAIVDDNIKINERLDAIEKKIEELTSSKTTADLICYCH